MLRLLFVIYSVTIASSAHAQERGIINNAQSPHVKLKSVDIGDCQWTSGFRADKFGLCEEVMVPHKRAL